MAARPKTTRLSGDTLVAPQTTSPGDAPADTYDAKERASSATPDKATAAAAGHQSVNAVKYVDSLPSSTPSGSRTELYATHGPTGAVVYIERNNDTGATTVIDEWESANAYTLDDLVAVTGGVLKCTTAGTSGSTAPSLPADVADTVSDGAGALVWTRVL